MSVLWYTAGDSLTYHNGWRFSTRDNDNDNHPHQSALIYDAASWYNSCTYSNLNGPYFNATTANSNGRIGNTSLSSSQR